MIEAYLTAAAAGYFICIAIVGITLAGWIFAKLYQYMCNKRKKRIDKMMERYFGENGEDKE